MSDIGAKQRHSLSIFIFKENDAFSLVGEASFSLCFFKETIVMTMLITVTPILAIPITFIGIPPVIGAWHSGKYSPPCAPITSVEH